MKNMTPILDGWKTVWDSLDWEGKENLHTEVEIDEKIDPVIYDYINDLYQEEARVRQELVEDGYCPDCGEPENTNAYYEEIWGNRVLCYEHTCYSIKNKLAHMRKYLPVT